MILIPSIILAIISLFLGYKIYTLRKAIKWFTPVYTQNNIVQIWITKPFTDEQDIALSVYKEALHLLLAKIDYRIASYTTVQNTCYRPRGIAQDNLLYELKSDSEKWMETGRMSGYIDIRSDIQYLISKETAK